MARRHLNSALKMQREYNLNIKKRNFQSWVQDVFFFFHSLVLGWLRWTWLSFLPQSENTIMTLLPKRFTATLLKQQGKRKKKEKIDLMYSQMEQHRDAYWQLPKQSTACQNVNNKKENAHCSVMSIVHLYQVTHGGVVRVYSIHTVWKQLSWKH